LSVIRGATVIVDLGADTFPSHAPRPTRIGDVDGNTATAELLAQLAAWGGYDDDCVLADLDLSGGVDTADLLTLLANWG
jgi:hypothetical protein